MRRVLIYFFLFGFLFFSKHNLKGQDLSEGKSGRLLFHLANATKSSPEGPLKTWDNGKILSALTAWFRKRQYPLPSNPDSIVALPRFPILLDGVPDLLRVTDLLRFQNRGQRLAIRVDPGLALSTSWARKQSWENGGCWWFEDLLPEAPLPRNKLIRPVPRGILLSRTQAPSSLAKYFARTILLFLKPSLRSQVRNRAAIELGALQILDWDQDLSLVFQTREDLRNALFLCQATSFALGGKAPSSPDQFMAWFRMFSSSRGDEAFYLGIALRRAFQRGKLPIELNPRNEPFATILAGLAPGKLAPVLEESVQSGLSPLVETSLVLSLAREGGLLSKELTSLALKRCFSKQHVPFGNQENRRTAAWLLLLLRRNSSALMNPLPHFQPFVCGRDLRRGKLFGRNLSQLGKKQSLGILNSLSQRKVLQGGDLGLLSSFHSFGVPGLGLSIAELKSAFKAKQTTPIGRVLLDLGIGEIYHPPSPSKENRIYLKKAFDRLLQYQRLTLRKPEGWDHALGKALGQILLLFPRGPLGQAPSLWIKNWVQEPNMRNVAMHAFGIAIKQRSSLFRDSLARLDQRKIGRIEALRILGKWNRLALRTPLPSGTSLWSPLDPLLGKQKLEFDLPLVRR
jgi:hypothetical protein